MSSGARFFAIVNPAAGDGRCGKLAPAALDRMRRGGITVEVAETKRAGDATALAREAYARGLRTFLSVGGDGTSYEIVNGLFPEALASDRPALGFLPLGTGNSFLRDFTTRGVEHTIAALLEGKRRRCDVLRLRHAGGDAYFLNVLNLGFPSEVGEITHRRFKRFGYFGYALGVLACLARLQHRAFPHRLDAASEWDRRPCLFLAFANSKFTGGNMMMAPLADISDGRIEYVRCAPVGRARLLWNFPRLFTGSYIEHHLASRAAVQRVEFDLAGPVQAIVDGEILHFRCRVLEVIPGALDAIV